LERRSLLAASLTDPASATVTNALIPSILITFGLSEFQFRYLEANPNEWKMPTWIQPRATMSPWIDEGVEKCLD
jgi:hypothetical protein